MNVELLLVQAFFWNYGLLPPQYVATSANLPQHHFTGLEPRVCLKQPNCKGQSPHVSFSEANPKPTKCPKSNDFEEAALYDEGVLPISPILKEAAMKLPQVAV